MKGRCKICDKNKVYQRLDMHIKRMHGNQSVQSEDDSEAMDQSEHIDEESDQSCQIPEEDIPCSWPFYFHLPEKFFKAKDAIRPMNEREPIDIDWQSCQLAEFLRDQDPEEFKDWLKHRSNSFTLMSLARMINLMNNLHVSQPSCQKPLDIKWSHQQARKKPKQMARFQKLFSEMEHIILHQFRPIFLKYADLIPLLLEPYK